MAGTVRFEGKNGTLTGKVSLKRVGPGNVPEVLLLPRTLSPPAMQEDFRILRGALEEGSSGHLSIHAEAGSRLHFRPRRETA